MSCFTSCMRKDNQNYQAMINRNSKALIRFDRNQIQQLRKKFQKVSGYRQQITLEAFKKNMGILGLHCAQQFSKRLFNAFDMDNDRKISFQDFVEYMQILSWGSEKSKAKISFKLIALKQSSIRINDFKEFLNDFFLSWSSITNIQITYDLKQRTELFVTSLFQKVKRQTGKQYIDVKYFCDSLYKDKQFMESFEFISQGTANMFIFDKSIENQSNPERVLYKVLKQLISIKQNVFDMTGQDSFQFQSVQTQQMPKKFTPFTPKFPNANKKQHSQGSGNETISNVEKKNENSRNNISENTTNKNYREIDFSQFSIHQKKYYQNKLNDSRLSLFEKQYENILEKKLKYMQEKINKIIKQTSTVYNKLAQKFENNQDLQKQRKSGFKNVHKKIKRVQGGNMIFFGDESWNLVLNMMIGIEMAVRSVRGIQEVILQEPKDFDLKYYFELVPRRFGDEQFESTIFSFTDYAPNTFNHIRKIFQIDNKEYIASIGPSRLMASLMMGQVSSMTSLTSQGKSGSFFYYTADGKYMLKTISHREYKFLRSILKDYYYYLKENPDTLITKFYGLHKLIQKDYKGDEKSRSYFVIMANVFNTKEKITERYDIKGSWYGRQTTDNDPSATRKDNDFKKRQSLKLRSKEKNKILEIIKKDAKFFEDHQIIDYSLLIGVIKKDDSQHSMYRNSMNQSKIFKFQEQKSIMRQTLKQPCQNLYATNPDQSQSYIFGIIDILTLYDSRKVAEYYFKRVFYGEGISAVPPPDYSKRFVEFIEDTVFSKQEDKSELSSPKISRKFKDRLS